VSICFHNHSHLVYLGYSIAIFFKENT